MVLEMRNDGIRMYVGEYTYEDFKKCPIGTRVTFEHGEVLVKVKKDSDCFKSESNFYRSTYDLRGFKDSWHYGVLGKIVKIEEPKYTTVYEIEKEILDEVEKRYLSNVIKPFKNKVKSIVKRESDETVGEHIFIELGDDAAFLPDFKKGTMYKGMKTGKNYTLKELGL